MSEVLELTVDEADEYYFGAIHTEDIEKRRWYTTQLVVFRHENGELYGFYYLDPATEMQDGQDRYESDPVKAFRVKEKQVTTTTYVPVGEGLE